MKLFLGAYFLAYILIAGAWRSWVVYRRIGKVPITLGDQSKETAHGYVGALGKPFMGAIGLVLVAYFASPVLYERLLPFTLLEMPIVRSLGVACLAIALPVVALAQAQMGDSWRIGIDLEQRTELVFGVGLYRYSRNPIYVGMLVTILGVFLVLPNTATLVVLVTGFLVLQIQIRLEEEHLESLHGEAFTRFKAQVRRWL